MKRKSQHTDSRELIGQIPPFQVTHRQLEDLFGSPRLVRRMILDGWFEQVRPGKSGRPALYDYESARRAYERFKAGENPAPLPWEGRAE